MRYAGSPDDAALNAGVARYRGRPGRGGALCRDADPYGRIRVPVLTVHAIHDPTAFVEIESASASTMERGGSAGRLVQAYTDHAEHSYLADAVYPAPLDALAAGRSGGAKPTPQAIAARCIELQPVYGGECRMDLQFRPQPLAQPRDPTPLSGPLTPVLLSAP